MRLPPEYRHKACVAQAQAAASGVCQVALAKRILDLVRVLLKFELKLETWVTMHPYAASHQSYPDLSAH